MSKLNYRLTLIVLSCAAVLITWSSVTAQELTTQWSPQQRIPIYEDFTEEPPLLIADQNHTVHAFNSQPYEPEYDVRTENNKVRGIFYRQWTVDGGWTKPIDILMPPGGRNYLQDVHYDPTTGTVHVLLNISSQYIAHSQAPLSLASNPRVWTEPIIIADQVQPVGHGNWYAGALAGDNKGNLVTIFGGSEDGNGFYYSISQDDGQTWSPPASLYPTFDPLIVPTAPKLFMGESGKIHAVGSTFLNSGAGGPGFYAQLDMKDLVWSEPIPLDEPGIRTPNVIEHNGTIMLVYYQNGINRNWWRASRDGGQTWSDPVQVSPPHKGTNGAVSFVVDGNDTLHLFFGQRIDDNNHGLWQSTWTGVRWADAREVVRGPQVRSEVGEGGFDPRSAQATVINGNLLLVTWGTDGYAGSNGAWFSYAYIDAPEAPAVPLPTAEITATPTPTLTPTATSIPPTVTPTPTLAPFEETEAGPLVRVFGSGPQAPIIVAVVPVLVIIAGLVLARRLA